MIALCPVPTAPAVVIYPGGTFVDCGATWIVEGDGSIVRERSITVDALNAGWRRYCADVHPGNPRAARVCFATHRR